ncbi:MAG: 1-acyl-sn-glycerol-3-phosphate acyltransferase [Prevotella sp.]|nr:1-acyl-sn-glycerol-3-phosphate acyltransferase [Prevotella sp.]MCM1074275.1 1-acyl-sn-glycerol-3-phosphate acyltransferase [Ruminococcus sp.]
MKYLFRIYQWLIAAPIMVLLTILACLFSLLFCLLFGHKIGGYWAPMIWSRAVCALAFVRVKVVGKENLQKGKSYVFVANHQGAFDIWAIYGYLGHNFKWLMKKSLEKVPMVGFTCKTVGHVFVDDSSVAGIKNTIEDAQKRLKQGMSLVIFPEGTRSLYGNMLPFKRGAFMLASEFKMPVVPLTIDGSFNVMPRNTYNITPGKITITIHKPIMPGENGFNTKQLMAQCKDAISSSLPD